MKGRAEINTISGLSEIMSFQEYMLHFEKNPERESRPSCLWLKDMFNYFGRSKSGGFNLFEFEDLEYPAVHGQNKVHEAIYQNLLNFAEEGHNNKFILMAGPNGSSKSSLVAKIMSAAEKYSSTDDGPLFTFSWIFPIDIYIKGPLGLGGDLSSHNLKTFAHLEDKDISAILPSDLKDHPLLLVPHEERVKLLEESLKKNTRHLKSVRKSYLYLGDMSKRNRMIYDALLTNYKGDHAQVLKHIRVERFKISKRYSNGAVTIEPQMHVDATIQQITLDRRLTNLPSGLQSLNLFTMGGEIVMANRGILEFSDLLKRPLDAFKYLLTTTETKNINLNGILTELDILFVGSSNEIHIAAFRQHPDFLSFKERMNFVRVPYLLNAKTEEKIYEGQIETLEDKCHFAPHTLNTLCLFAVMTRLRGPQQKNFENSRAGAIIGALSPMEKALFLSEEYMPERLSNEERQILKAAIDDVLNEFENDNLYEGKFGISPRTMKKIIYDLSSRYNSITFLEVLEYLKEFIEKKAEYDFLNMAPQGDYHNPNFFLEALQEYNIEILDKEVRESLGLVDERSYKDYIASYITQVGALIKGERVKNDITGKFDDPDMFLIQEFEKNIGLKENPPEFRSSMISTLGAWALDNPGQKIIYTVVFPEIVKSLKASFREEQKRLLAKIGRGFLLYEKAVQGLEKDERPEDIAGLTTDIRRDIDKVLENLRKNFSYSLHEAMALLKYLIDKRY
jgi:predicted Ser/Thr protein kinase